MVLIIGACSKDDSKNDIRNATITLLSPADNIKTPVNKITFSWEATEGADKYNIQIVKPDFSALQTRITDTNTAGTKYTRTLAPGIYQWRVKAYSARGSSAYTVFNFRIDTSSNLSDQLVVLVNPVNGYLTASRSVLLSWNAIPSATNYQLEILEDNSQLKDTTTTDTSYIFRAPPNPNTSGGFSWKVKAFNNTSVTQFNTAINFTVDSKAPNQPVLVSPANLSNHVANVILKWTRNSQTISDVRYDSIYVATDSTFHNPSVVAAARVNGTQMNTMDFSAPLGPNSTTTEKYFWKVRSIDSVGNASPFSSWLKFTITP